MPVKIKNGPWTITSSTQVYSNPWMTVREDKIIQIDGQPGLFGVATLRNGTAILALDSNHNVYLGRHFKYALGRESIEAFSGGLEPGEEPQPSAQRELLEEGGLSSDKWTDLGTVHPYTSTVSCWCKLYLAEDVEVHEQVLDGNEQVEVLKVPLSEAVAMALDGRIVSTPTIVLILKAQRLLQARAAKHPQATAA